MWFVIGLPGGSHGIQASNDGSEDRSSAVILDSTLQRTCNTLKIRKVFNYLLIFILISL